MKVLLVEDDHEIAEAVKAGLEDAGYAVTVAGDGERALTSMVLESYALVLLDLMLPGIDGLTVCRQMREMRINAPVLMLTAKDAVPDRVGGLEAGADDYLCKPFDFDELIARIRALLRRDKTLKLGQIHIGDLSIDTATRKVTRNGRTIYLTPREYSLLEALATHEGQILSREAIQERVWLDELSISNTVDVCVRSLRRKLDNDPGARLINTVYGMGYVLNSPAIAS